MTLMLLDVVRSVVCPTSAIGNHADTVDWMKLNGSIGTNMEHAVLDVAYGVDDNVVEAVSTGMIFTEAVKQGIALHILDDPVTLEAGLAVISAHSVVKNHIRAYVNAGYKATIPQCSVTVGKWYGQGWLLEDEGTGAAGYMICGGLNNETTMVNGGSGTTVINNPIATFQSFIAKLIPGIGSLQVGIVALFAVSKFFSILPVMLSLTGLLFGYVFVLLGIALIIASFYTPPISIWIRRREYAYA